MQFIQPSCRKNLPSLLEVLYFLIVNYDTFSHIFQKAMMAEKMSLTT